MQTTTHSNLKILVAATTDLGGRTSQQDEYLIHQNLFKNTALYAVFDGHGSEGAKASNFAKINFPKVFATLENQFFADPIKAIHQAFAQINLDMEESGQVDTYLSGTTAVMLIIHERTAYIANAGDSRAVLGQKIDGTYKGSQLSTDHTLNNTTELARIKAKGARIEPLENDPEGPLRIFKGSLPYPGLVVTRSIGDSVATRLGVTSEPEITTHTITPNDAFIVLASDGVWDGTSTERVVELVSKNVKDPEKASKSITENSLKGLNDSALDDNTTNIVLIFQENK